MRTTALMSTASSRSLQRTVIERRDLRPDDVDVRVTYCGVCHSDLHALDSAGPAAGLVPGHEFVGEVVAVGSAVTSFAPGDPVAVGNIVDSCGTCEMCVAGQENFCREFPTLTYQGRDRHDGSSTLGSYSTEYVVRDRFVYHRAESLDAAGVPAEDAQRVLTIASIIQREGLTADFPKVSRVIQNRLDIDMKLQMDSTAQYGYGSLHEGVVSSSAEALEDDNAWNTYVREGLPAGPIANPGDKAIDAAMHPAEGPWLYFVTWNMDTGETIFSATYEEHQAGIDQWHAWCDANDNRGC